MSTRIHLAWRNLLRNSRRTIVNILMIAGGFAAIVVFDGFGEFMLKNLRSVFISVQYGHFQIGTESSWNATTVEDPNERLIENPPQLAEKLKPTLPQAKATGRLGFFAMLSTPTDSMSARAVSYVPSAEDGITKFSFATSGHHLNHDDAFEVVLGEGLAKSLHAKVGDRLTILAQTVQKAVNAIDVEVVGTVVTGLTESDNITFYIPLKTAQGLLNTTRIERLVYFYPQEWDDKRIDTTAVGAVLPAGLKAKSWHELATFYNQAADYYHIQNIVISLIILILVMLSISNTVSNSIIERTGEIGTIRAMGDRRSDIIKQFFLEGLLLSAVSCLVAVFVSVVISIVITRLDIRFPMPGSSVPVPIGICIIPTAYIRAFLLTSATATMASVYPAWKVSKTTIVDALKRNI